MGTVATTSFEPQRVRAILFDIDGTLADTDDAAVAKLAKLLSPLARAWPRLRPEPTARRIIMAAETPLNALYAWWDRLYLDELTAPLLRLLPRRQRDHRPVPLVPGVQPMLESAHRHFPLGAVTARGRRSALALLESAGIQDYFSVVVTTRTARRAKPHPAPILWAADELGIAPENCLMVGDTTLDIRSARAAGAQAAAVLCGFGERRELERVGAHLILDSTADLLEHLPGQG
ncbi:MAG: HAD family hydrolase [Anaerolineales bacterium]|nr:HAD family hydrolase [Anaerolineales bacterium]